jgi:hypothetical protein
VKRKETYLKCLQLMTARLTYSQKKELICQKILRDNQRSALEDQIQEEISIVLRTMEVS